MAENTKNTKNTETNTSTESNECNRRGPSFSLLIIGLLVLAVAAWAFIGPVDWSITSLIPAGWIAVIAAVVVGVLLVVSPRRRH